MARADAADEPGRAQAPPAKGRRAAQAGAAAEPRGDGRPGRGTGAALEEGGAGGAAAGAGAEAGVEELPFETAMARLEAVVDRLEGGELELEAALASFEEGVALTRHCAEQLDAAERRIELLMQEGDAWVARPFDDAPGTEDPDAEDPAEDPDEESEGWEE